MGTTPPVYPQNSIVEEKHDVNVVNRYLFIFRILCCFCLLRGSSKVTEVLLLLLSNPAFRVCKIMACMPLGFSLHSFTFSLKDKIWVWFFKKNESLAAWDAGLGIQYKMLCLCG